MLQFLQGIIQFFLPVEKYFFDFVDAAASSTNEAAELLETLCTTASPAERDKAMRDMADALDRTFVTPLDREDLYALTSSIESVSDYALAAATQVILHHIEVLPSGGAELAGLLHQATARIQKATPLLRSGTDGGKIRAECVAIERLEHDADVVWRREIGKRFAEETDAIKLLKDKEFLEKLEDGVDRCQQVARVLESILIKNG